jgi:hypothetical protein
MRKPIDAAAATGIDAPAAFGFADRRVIKLIMV